ncbi:MAG: HAMP domain-containing protein [Candidatus Latescibacteria bacterium]|nr:HAMP domain-containing protein [Candidatus Latescibacterota bacterium]
MRSLTWKLMLGFLVVCLVEAVLVVIFARRATEREFDQYVRERVQGVLVVQLENYFAQEGSWATLEERSWEGLRERSWGRGRRSNRGERANRDEGANRDEWANRGESRGRRSRYEPLFALVNQERQVVLPAGDLHSGDAVAAELVAQGRALEVDGQVVGTIVRVESDRSFSPGEKRYLARTYQVLLYALVGSLAIALFLGAVLARTFTRPLQQLKGATDILGQGQLGHQVPVRSKDELGQLTAAFNRMSADLQRLNGLRRQMTADIAHELRTPLTTLSGYLEAMRDGVLEPEPQRLEMMYGEVSQLNHLVDDLRTLALADAGELSLQTQSVEVGQLLNGKIAAFTQRAAAKDVKLAIDGKAEYRCLADPVRLEQVLDNLLDNALRHTPAGGSVSLRAGAREEMVEICVADTGPGIPPEDLAHIFERFYQVDKVRAQGEGNSGLGLAIARSLVEAQGGRLEVESRVGGGTVFVIALSVID